MSLFQPRALLLALLTLAGHVTAIRIKTHSLPLGGLARASSEFDVGQTLNRGEVEEAIKTGLQASSKLTCKDIPIALNNDLHLIVQEFKSTCPNQTCTLPLSDSRLASLMAFTSSLMSLVGLADTKRCLEEVMKDSTIQQRVADVNAFWNMIISRIESEEQRKRMNKAWNHLQKWKDKLKNMSGIVVDRDLFFPGNIEHSAICPSPCKQCSKDHNSWYKTREQFRFKCILNSADSPPSQPEVQCETPRLRWSRPWESKSWCEVRDWKVQAFQKATLEAILSCSAWAVVAPLSGIEKIPDSIYATCLAVEMGGAVTEEQMDSYQTFSQSLHPSEHSHKESRALLAVFMTLGLADSLASIREKSSGNDSPSIWKEIPTQGSPVPIDVLSKCEPPNLHVGHAFMAVGKVIAGSLMFGILGIPLGILSSKLMQCFVFAVIMTAPLGLINLAAAGAGPVLYAFLRIVGVIVHFIHIMAGTGGPYPYVNWMTNWWNSTITTPTGNLYDWLGSYETSPVEYLPVPPTNCPASHFITRSGKPRCLAAMKFDDSSGFRCGGPDSKWISVNCSSQYGGTMVLSSGC